MRLSTLTCAACATLLAISTANAQNNLVQPQSVVPTSGIDSYSRPNAEASPSDRVAQLTPTAFSYEDSAENSADAGCACESEPACCCESSCCCEPSCGCDSCGCGGWGMGDCLGDCCLGDPWTLSSCLTPCCDSPTYGGWVSFGYYNKNERWSFQDGDQLSFNDFPDHLNLDQAWFYVERVAEAGACSADYGYRFDVMYGAQAHTAQAFGNDGGTWDIAWDHGIYGWAIPQLYGEVAYGDLSVKVGHFWTPAGYEVVPAIGNFFYTHTLTHFNSEPFTHTGVLGTYSGSDNVTLYGGWALGWDTGFDQFGAGNIFVGGFGVNAGDNVTFTWITTAGNLGWYTSSEPGWTNHFVAIADLSDNTQWVIQSDVVDTDGSSTDPAFDVHTLGLTNYLFYTLNDCWKLGGRIEWYKSNNYAFDAGPQTSFYDVTAGVNYRPHANFVVRPEIRYDWTPSADRINAVSPDFYNQWSFSIDAVFTY